MWRYTQTQRTYANMPADQKSVNRVAGAIATVFSHSHWEGAGGGEKCVSLLNYNYTASHRLKIFTKPLDNPILI